MDLYAMDTELLKCEPEVIVKFEPLFTENSYDVTVNNDDLVKTESESVSLSSCDYGSLNNVIIKEECTGNQLATLLPTTNISVSVEPGFKEEPSWAASEHSQENTGNLLSTKNSTSCSQERKSKTRTKTRHYCPYCNRKFTRRESFNIHLWRRHSRKNPDETLEKCNLRARPTFSCRFCNTTFTRKASLADHLLCQHGENFDKSLKTLFSQTINYCKLCDYKTIFINKLNQHMKHVHSLVKTDTKLSLRCNNCDYETFRKRYLREHIQRKHSNDRPTYSCRICNFNKTFIKKDSLANHLLCQHDEKFDKSLKTLFSRTIKQCQLCDFRAINKIILNRHIQKQHSKDRPTYSCRFCNKTVIKKDSLANHLLRQHGEKFDNSLKTLFSQTIKYCKLCDFKTISTTKLNQHMKHAHKKLSFSCNNCDYETFQNSYLRDHIRREHSNDRYTYRCRFCNKTFFNKVSLANHLLCKHGEEFDKSLKTILSLTIEHCKSCDFRVINKNRLNHHIQKQHSTDRPTHLCRFCNKTLLTKGSLANHLLFYHDDKLDKSLKTLFSMTIKYCKLCDFKTIFLTKLNRHMKHAHSPVKADTDTILSFRCNNCDYETLRKCDLQAHIQRKHSNDRDTYSERIVFKCNNCDYETLRKCDLQAHNQRKHSNVRPTYLCRFCDKSFFMKISLADHLLRQHGEKFDKSLNTLLLHAIKYCQLCDFKTVLTRKLNEHITKHYHSLVKADSNAIMYKCNNCDYETFKKRNLQAHSQSYHK